MEKEKKLQVEKVYRTVNKELWIDQSVYRTCPYCGEKTWIITVVGLQLISHEVYSVFGYCIGCSKKLHEYIEWDPCVDPDGSPYGQIYYEEEELNKFFVEEVEILYTD